MDEKLCPACGEANPTRAKFCLECGDRFGTTSAASLIEALGDATGVQGERRVVTVLFADLSGFTSYSERTDVEDVHALADETASKLGEIVERYGGYVDKIIGDCVMAVFGAPISHEDDPVRGVRAALDMQDYVTEHSDRFAQLPLTIGLNTGEALWAPVGPDGRHTVLGDTVNTAARLQGAASKREILIGEATAEGSREVIELEEVEPIRAKNKEEPVRAYKAIRVIGAVTVTRQSRTKTWGRGTELERLGEIWEVVREEKRPYLATLIGPTGIGKSRLVEEVVRAAGDDTVVLEGRCLPYGEGITYWPVVEIIRSAAGIAHDDDTATVSSKLGVLLEGLGSTDLDELRTIAVSLAHLVGAPTTPRGTYTATEISKGELHWGLRRILELVAANSDVICVLDDLHWAEPTLLELIGFIIESTQPAPILVMAVGRPELRGAADEQIGSRTNHRMLEVGALADDDARAMVGDLLGSREVGIDTIDRLLRTAGGNPLFIEEMTQMWADADAAGTDEPEVPQSLMSVITSRLDRLTPAELRILSRASVVGNVFWEQAVEALAGENGARQALDMLEVRDLVRRRGDSSVEESTEYEFKHGLIRDVAYGRLTKSERVALHARCAEWISTRPSGFEELTEVVAYHLEQACLLANEVSRADPPPRLRAVTALRKAAEKAESHQGMHEADRFYERALGVAGQGMVEATTDIRLRRARLGAVLGDLEASAETLIEVVSIAREIQRPDLTCRALINLCDVDLTLGRINEALVHLSEATSLATTLDDSTHRIRTAFMRALLSGIDESQDEDPAVLLREAVELAEDVEDRSLFLAALVRLGTHLYNVGDLDEAEAAFERASKVAADHGSLLYQAAASRALCTLGYQRGPREEAERLATQVLAWTERLGARLMRGEVLQLLAQFALARDDVELAGSYLKDALELADGSTGTESEINRYLAEVAWRRARPAQARRAAEAAVEAASEEDPQLVAMAHIAEAFAAAADGRDQDSRSSFDLAIGSLTEDEDLALDLAEATFAYGRLLASFGDLEGARERLSRAHEALSGMGAAATAADAQEALQRLA
jgi:class 3 adenylate cyclase/tetratricopeptide (TPR) repeat protein